MIPEGGANLGGKRGGKRTPNLLEVPAEERTQLSRSKKAPTITLVTAKGGVFPTNTTIRGDQLGNSRTAPDRESQKGRDPTGLRTSL